MKIKSNIKIYKKYYLIKNIKIQNYLINSKNKIKMK